MADILVYETSDPEFADEAIEKMQSAGVSCYRTGQGYSELGGPYRDLGNSICIYIRRQEDYRQANDILIKAGAVVEKPIQFKIGKAALFVIGVVVAVILVILAQG